MLILTHTLAFLAGFVSAVALMRYVAARYVARPPRPLSRRRRVAIRQDDEARLWQCVLTGADALHQLDKLYEARGVRPPAPGPDWIDEINAVLNGKDTP